MGNYTNPFNPSTTIVYELPERGHARMSVYDIMGREVHVLVDATRGAGIHELRFEAKLLPTGVYLYRMEAVQDEQPVVVQEWIDPSFSSGRRTS